MSTEPASLHLAQKRLQALPFVGRSSELSRLTHCFDAVLRGERQLVFVNGQPGIGKTTLIEAFLQQVPLGDQTWRMRGQCVEHYGAGEAYLPLLEALSRLGRESTGKDVVAVLKQYAPTWLAQLPTLVNSMEQNVLQRVLVGATRECMLREIAEALEVLSMQRLLVIVLEDLHWGDQSTTELLAYLMRRRGPARLLVLGTYRPTEISANTHPLQGLVRELQGREHCLELRLDLLSESEVCTYVTQRFPGLSRAEDLGAMIFHRTAGNPLFTAIIVEQLVREGVVENTKGQWRIEEDLKELETNVPESVRLLIERQLETLDEEEQRLLAVASVVGVDWYLARTTLRFHHNDCSDDQVLGLGAVNQSSLIAQSTGRNRAFGVGATIRARSYPQSPARSSAIITSSCNLRTTQHTAAAQTRRNGRSTGMSIKTRSAA